ncbi:MAG: ATP-binding cassette domain-containing protein [Epsilonproteobacteria bacterium]|nr:ATP-binding cassette domain-containing protein [Campylobacterota bacterium]
MEKVVELKDIVTKFGKKVVHDRVSLTVNEGEIYGILGGSGSGKSTLMNEMIMLLRPYSGEIKVLGKDILRINKKDALYLKHNWGVLFQSGALFSSLNIRENIDVLLKEYTKLSKKIRDEMIEMKIELVGLGSDVLDMYPSELSGGMIKRVALARALIMDPKILFLDEPTSGLDPIGSRDFDNMLINLRDILGFTAVIVTHDLETVKNIMDRFVLLGNKKAVAEGTLDEVLDTDNEYIKKFFNVNRGETRRVRYGK